LIGPAHSVDTCAVLMIAPWNPPAALTLSSSHSRSCVYRSWAY